MHKLAHLAISDEGFVFDPTTGDSFQVSQTGLDILSGLRAGKGNDAIAHSLAGRYAVGVEEAQRDVADFQEHLKNLGLV